MFRGGFLFALAGALLVAWRWFTGLRTGFWIDECGAYWLSRHLPDVIAPPFTPRTLNFAYAALLSLFNWADPPFLELIARLPSVLAALACAWVLYRFAEQAIGPGTGWLATAVYLLLPHTADFATEARPYALGQLLFALALWTQWTWLRTGHRLLPHLACLIALVYLHPFFLLAWPLCWLIALANASAPRGRYTLRLITAGLFLLPYFYVLANLHHTAATAPYLPQPTLRALIGGLLQGWVGVALLALLLAATLLGERPTRLVPPLGAPWWAAIAVAWPLSLYVLARLTGNTVFVPRYYALSAIGFAMFATALLSLWRTDSRRLIVGLWAALCLSPLIPKLPPHHGQDLRVLATWVEQAGRGSVPWFAPSLFIEGRLPDSTPPDVRLQTSNFSHLTTYPVSNPLFPLPYGFPIFARPQVEKQLDGPWRAERQIVIGPAEPLPTWVREVFSVRGFREQQLGVMYLYERD